MEWYADTCIAITYLPGAVRNAGASATLNDRSRFTYFNIWRKNMAARNKRKEFNGNNGRLYYLTRDRLIQVYVEDEDNGSIWSVRLSKIKRAFETNAHNIYLDCKLKHGGGSWVPRNYEYDFEQSGEVGCAKFDSREWNKILRAAGVDRVKGRRARKASAEYGQAA